MHAKVGARTVLVGRLAVTDRRAQAFLTRVAKSKHPAVKLRYWLGLSLLRHGKPIKSRSKVFVKTVDATVARR